MPLLNKVDFLWSILVITNTRVNEASETDIFTKRVQAVIIMLAPKIFSTPFQDFPYQKSGNIEKRCRFILGVSSRNIIRKAKPGNFSVLHKAFTAFAYSVRAPPSEI